MDFSSNHSCTYYPFGMEMPGRTYTNTTLTQTRFGFNGKETVDEISGKGNHNTALFWEYDTRLGRRWNVDPLASKYPSMSPYAFSANNPLFYIIPRRKSTNTLLCLGRLESWLCQKPKKGLAMVFFCREL